jgi:ribose 1,5-bisphosphokinase PhnN
MAKHSKAPIDVLKKGLDKLKQHIQSNLEARLQRKERLTDVEEQWLDNDGNIIEEQRIFETLEGASDYELEYKRQGSCSTTS